jgi:nucleotide-binding universal stress UspA family protein
MTSTIRKILLPTDFSAPSERAVGYAATLAKSLGASVHLVHVLENPSMVGSAWHAADMTSVREQRYHDGRAKLAAVASTLHRPADLVSVEVRTGLAADEIVDAAIDYGCDLIVMATHGRSGLPHLVLGSVTEEVIRRAPCPVLAVRQSGAVRVHATKERVAAAAQPLASG